MKICEGDVSGNNINTKIHEGKEYIRISWDCRGECGEKSMQIKESTNQFNTIYKTNASNVQRIRMMFTNVLRIYYKTCRQILQDIEDNIRRLIRICKDSYNMGQGEL